MTGAEIHLITVHVPVVVCAVAAAALITAQLASSPHLERFAYALLIVCGVTSVIAYYSGPPAAELLKTAYGVTETARVEHHAVIGRAAFVAAIVVAVAAINALLQVAQGEAVPRWLRGLILAAAILLMGVFVWASHEGGTIRHPEVRELLDVG